MVGQTHITQTLANALKTGRLPHALLFTGPRGTGKTSSARILAKSLRCPNAVNFVPCGVCPSCLDIAAGRSTDVIEIDGASNNGVDAIRELREGVAFMPSFGKFKIYIIDEVHMLSTSAFNALLKTLEEPPEHVIFIMATTEVHKIPQTILSRCQRFDFRRIPTRVIADQMALICQQEKFAADNEALWIIARQGDGSMRDALSLLDQVITFSNGQVTKETAIEILGLTDRALLMEAITALVQRDTPSTLQVLERVARAGYEPSLFLRDLLEHFRCTLIIKISTDLTTDMIDLPDSEVRFLKDLGSNASEEDLHLLFDMTLKGASDIARSSEPRIVLEMALLRMAAAPRVLDLKKFFAEGPRGHNANPISPNAAAKPAVSGAPTSSSRASTTAKTEASPAVPLPKLENALTLSPSEKWFEFVQEVRKGDGLLAAKVENLVFLGEEHKMISLSIPAKLGFLKDQMMDPEMHKKLQTLIERYFGPGFQFQLKAEEKAAPAAGVTAQKLAVAKEKQKVQDLTKQAADHPLVKSAHSVFKGNFKLKDRESGSKGR